MKNKKVMEDSSIQLAIDFQTEITEYISEEKSITFSDNSINITKQSIVININDCKKYIEEKRNNKIIDYVLKNAKRF